MWSNGRPSGPPGGPQGAALTLVTWSPRRREGALLEGPTSRAGAVPSFRRRFPGLRPSGMGRGISIGGRGGTGMGTRPGVAAGPGLRSQIWGFAPGDGSSMIRCGRAGPQAGAQGPLSWVVEEKDWGEEAGEKRSGLRMGQLDPRPAPWLSAHWLR